MIIQVDPQYTEKMFFTADQHFGHGNIIRFCERPFGFLPDMDRALVENWNRVVSHDGVVFHLGDFCLEGPAVAAQYFEALNGKINIIGLDWHHDKRWIKYCRERPNDPMQSFDHKVEILPPEIVIEVLTGAKRPRPTIHLSHYPIGDWDRKYHGGWHLHGHSHGKYKGDNHLTGDLCWDVGVDAVGVGYTPISFGAILEWAYESGWV